MHQEADGVDRRVLRVTGKHFVESRELRCSVGSETRYVSTSLVHCRLDPLAYAGNLTVEVSNNGQDFSADGISHVVSGAGSWRQLSLQPSSGPLHGGTMVTISGGQWSDADYATCIFGDTLAVEGTVMDDGRIECRVTAVGIAASSNWLGREVRVQVVVNGQDASQGSELAFEYEAPVVVSGIVPSAGAVEGSTMVQVLGSGFKAGSGLGCMFALSGEGGGGSERVMTEGRLETSSRMVCEAPRAGSEQTVSVEVSNNGADLTSSGVQFVYERAPTVTGVELADADSDVGKGVLLRVTGKHFVQSPSLRCKRGAGSGGMYGMSDAQYVSSSLVYCRTEEQSGVGKSAIEVSNNGQDFSSNAVSWGPRSLDSDRFVYAISPRSGPSVGGTVISVIGSSLDSESTLSCVFGDSPSVAAVTLSSTLLLCSSPPSVTIGRVEFRVKDDSHRTLGSANDRSDRFVYSMPMSVLSVAPSSGDVTGSTLVSVVGADFDAAGARSMHCKFAASNQQGVVSEGSIVTSSVLVCITPSAKTKGLAVLEVSNNGIDYTRNAVQFLFAEPIAIASVQPSILVAGSANTVTISGAGFRPSESASCVFGQMRSRIEWISGSQVLCSVSKATPGNVTMEVSNNGVDFSSSSLRVWYIDKTAVIARMDVRFGSVQGGTRVAFRLSGVHLDMASLSVTFGESVATCTVQERPQIISCSSPPSHIPDTVQVHIALEHAQLHFLSPLYFDYIADPVVISLHPSSGPVFGGGLVRVQGANFVMGSTHCAFGKAKRRALATVFSSSSMTCAAPPSVASVVSVMVSSNGQEYSADQPQATYIYTRGFSILSIQPSVMTTGAQHSLTVSGGPFADQGTIICQHGLSSARYDGQVVSSTSIKCLSMASDLPGNASISISDNGHDFVMAADIQALWIRPIEIISVSPTLAAIGSPLQVRISEMEQSLELACRFGADDVTRAYLITQSELRCSAPMMPSRNTHVQLVDTVKHQNVLSTFSTVNVDRLVVWSIEPCSGPEHGGSAITVYGQGFEKSEHVLCRFNTNTSVSARYLTSSSLRCISPIYAQMQLSSSSVTLDVTIGNEVFMSPGIAFTYEPVPTIVSFHPTQITAHGSSIVTVVGSGFRSSSTDGPFCRFGSQLVVPGRLVSQDSIECIVSPGQLSGNATVALSLDGEHFHTSSTVDAAISISTGAVFETVSPSFGYLFSSSLVTIIGSGFEASPDVFCCADGIPADASMSSFLTSSMRSCSIPAQKEPRSVALTLSWTDACSDANKIFTADFAVVHPPIVIGVKPSFGVSAGGSILTVAGQHFTMPQGSGLECVFGEGATVEAMIVNGDAVLCVSPAHEQGAVSLTLNARGSTAWQSPSMVFWYDQPLGVSSFWPNRGVVSEDLTITVAGMTFSPERRLVCLFGGIHARQSTYITSTQLSCKVPAVLVGNSTVEVEYEGGASEPTLAGVLQADAQTRKVRLTPSLGPLGGETVVTFYVSPGQLALESSSVECVFGNTAVVGTVKNSAGTCISPARAAAGAVDVQIQGEDGDMIGSSEFVYLAPEVLNTVIPSSGPIHGGFMVEARGSGFSESPHLACAYISSGRAAVPALWRTSSLVTCHMPSQEEGEKGGLEISNNGQDFTSSGVRFIYERAPTVTEVGLIVADQLVDGEGRVLQVAGAHFVESQELRCSTGMAQKYISSSLIHCHVDAQRRIGNFTVEVSNNGHDFSIDGIGYSMAPISNRAVSLAPSSGPMYGGTLITISGGDWTNAGYAVCMFGASKTPVEGTVMDDGRIQCRVAAHSGSVSVHGGHGHSVSVAVMVDGEHASQGSELAFEYEAPVVVSGIVPSAGAVEGSTMVQVLGSGFKAGSGLGCMFALSGEGGGGSERVMTEGRLETSSRMVCEAPRAGSEQTVSVEVSNNGADLTSSGVQFVYERAPTVTGVELVVHQEADGVDRRVLRVTGKHFVESRELRCSVGSETRYVSTSLVHCRLDPLAYAGNLTVEVSNNGQDFSADGISHVVSGAGSWRLLSLQPSSGPLHGGTMVTISGGQWSDADYATCIFGDTLAVEGTVMDDGRIECRVTAVGIAASSSWLGREVRVQVVVNGQDASQGSELAFEYEAPVVVSGIVPSAGAVEGSTMVQVLGSGFKAGSGLGCMFALSGEGGGGSERVMTEGRLETSSRIVCEAPRAGSEQTVSVEVSNNGADLTSSGVQFVYERAPTVTGVELADADSDVGKGVLLRVTGKHFVQSPSLRCKRGAGSGGMYGMSDAQYVSSSLVYCRTEEQSGVGKSAIEVSNNGQDFSTNGIILLYRLAETSADGALGDRTARQEPFIDRIAQIVPSFGPDQGGTFVSVVLKLELQLGSWVNCIMGESVIPSESIIISKSVVQCKTQSKTASHNSHLTILVNNDTIGTAAFIFEPASEVLWLLPQSGSIYKNHNVTVMGRHFSNTGALTCRVGMGRQAVARWLSSTSVVCVLPAAEGHTGGTQNVTVDVSNNGADFSEGGGARFRYVAGSATVASMTPSWGPSGRGTAVTVVGAGLEEAEEGLVMCRVGSMTASCAGRTEGRGVGVRAARAEGAAGGGGGVEGRWRDVWRGGEGV